MCARKNKKGSLKKKDNKQKAPIPAYEISFDSFHYLNAKAAKEAIESKFHFLPERGICYEGFDLNFDDRNWYGLAQQPRDACPAIVGEFYVNGRHLNEDMGYVRARYIRFDAKRINEHYGISDIANCHYGFLKADGFRNINMEELNSCLGVESTMWWYGMQEKKLPALRLNATSRAVHKFICARFLPTELTSVVTLEQAVLNWCIQERKPINWGQIVHDVIWEATKGKGVGGYPFPHLITDICAAAGTTVLPCMRTLPPFKALVNKENIQQLCPDQEDVPQREEKENSLPWLEIGAKCQEIMVAKLEALGVQDLKSQVASLQQASQTHTMALIRLMDNEDRLHNAISGTVGSFTRAFGSSNNRDLSSQKEGRPTPSPKDN